jgi:hypothetical protein
MNTMTKLLGLTLAALSVSAVACGDDEGSGGSGTTSSSTTTTSAVTTGMGQTTTTGSSTSTGMNTPNVPALGNQIDRMGRAAINTAANTTFAPDAQRDPAQDAYNADATIASWGGDYAATAAAQLGVLDSLDATCGNGSAAGGSTMAGAYGTVSTVLANDYLVVKGDAPNGCDGSYLSVELDTLTAMDSGLCGGRKPAHDSIAVTYTVVAGVPFDDGVTAPSKSQVETFPYLAPAP